MRHAELQMPYLPSRPTVKQRAASATTCPSLKWRISLRLYTHTHRLQMRGFHTCDNSSQMVKPLHKSTTTRPPTLLHTPTQPPPSPSPYPTRTAPVRLSYRTNRLA